MRTWAGGKKKREMNRSTALSGLPAYISRVRPSCQKSRLVRAMNGFSGARFAAGDGGGGGSAAVAAVAAVAAANAPHREVTVEWQRCCMR